jgi:hypothetical protein
MNKYGLLIFLLVYALALATTNAVFYLSVSNNTFMGVNYDTGNQVTGKDFNWLEMVWTILLAFIGILVINGLPLWLFVIFWAPYFIMLIYFIYLNLPKTVVGGTPQP